MNVPAPYYGSALRRLPRPAEQMIVYQDALALVTARKIQNVTFVAKVGLFEVASLSNLEGELTKQVPLAGPRLEAIGNTAAAVIAAEIGRLASGL